MNKHQFKSHTSFALGVLLASSSVWAETLTQDDLIGLKKIVIAARQTNYVGTFFYQSGSYIETSRITHVLEGENEHERLEGLDGERSEVIRKNKQVWCFQGDSKLMVASREGTRTFPALLPEQLALLQENYQISRGEEDRVAGFQAYSVIFQPRDKMRYSHKMWAHKETGLLLKAAVMDDAAKLIEQYSFTQLSIGGEIDRKWIGQHKSATRGTIDHTMSASTLREEPHESGWGVYALPAGFKKITEMNRRFGGNSAPATQLVYSDGLAGISVFIEKLGDKNDIKPGLYSKGAIQIYIKVLNPNLLTVVGEVPSRTVMQVAQSVKFVGQQK